MNIKLSLFATVALALIFFYIGTIIKRHVKLFRTFCLPTAVIGGLLFSIINFALHDLGGINLGLDGVFQNLCMVAFFTSIGYSASFKTIKSAGKDVIILTVITGVLICLQNVVGGYMAGLLGLPKVLGITMGSIALVGGHGNAGAFGPQIESMGIAGASTVALAAATFGLVFGSIFGGPVANFLIKIKNIKVNAVNAGSEAAAATDESKAESNCYSVPKNEVVSNIMLASFHLFISMAAGTYLSAFIKSSTHLTIPVFLSSMCIAMVIRNVAEYSGLFAVKEEEGNIIGSVSLNIFISLAMMSVKLWQLISLALPMTIILLTQVVICIVFIVLVTFTIMGKDYEAAVISAAQIGYGFGATPNAMANIAAIEEKYGSAPKSRLVIPFVGGLFTSLINAFLIMFFINFFK